MAYDNTNTIAIFENRNRDKENSPLLTGRVNVEGIDYRISLWAQKSNKDPNMTFWSGKIQKAEPREPSNNGGLPPTGTGSPAQSAAPAQPAAPTDDLGDDIPF
jgi:hypothetical protein